MNKIADKFKGGEWVPLRCLYRSDTLKHFNSMTEDEKQEFVPCCSVWINKTEEEILEMSICLNKNGETASISIDDYPKIDMEIPIKSLRSLNEWLNVLFKEE